jgi:hypothetical protein
MYCQLCLKMPGSGFIWSDSTSYTPYGRQMGVSGGLEGPNGLKMGGFDHHVKAG